MRLSENTSLALDSDMVALLPAMVPALEDADVAQGTAVADVESHRACDLCGARARIDILDGYANGTPVRRAFCLMCARASLQAPLRRPPRVRLATLAAVAGAVVLVVGVWGDYLIPAGNAGFGWHQRLGVILGGLIGLFGLLLRADLVTLAGAFLFGVSLTADWFGLTHGPGIGWKQQCMIALGSIVLLSGLLVRVRHRLRWVFSRWREPLAGSGPAGELVPQ